MLSRRLRHHREHDEEFGLSHPGQPHDDVVRLHRGRAAAARLARELPRFCRGYRKRRSVGLVDAGPDGGIYSPPDSEMCLCTPLTANGLNRPGKMLW